MPRPAVLAARNECATPVRIAATRCEPVTCSAPHPGSQLHFGARLEAQLRTRGFRDQVIKIGRRPTFRAYGALTAGQPISAPSAITLI